MKNRFLTPIILIGWGALMAVVIAAMALKHSATLPPPADEKRLADALLKLRKLPSERYLVHIIYSECSCSSGLLTHLADRRARAGDEELILFIGSSDRQIEAAKRAGYEVTVFSVSSFQSRFGLEGAPVLAIFDAAGNIRYAGGYYDHPAAIRPLDEKIYREAFARTTVEPLPVYGCAIDAKLQKDLDPLNLK